MATFKTFEEIEAWKKARELTKRVYAVSGSGAFAKDFSLKDQIRRASVSIMSNIAEGYDRSGTGEFVQFLANSKGIDRRGQVPTVCCAGPNLHRPAGFY